MEWKNNEIYHYLNVTKKREWAEITKYADMRKGCTTHINQKFREEHDYNRLIMYRNPYLNDGKNSRHFQQQELGI